MKKILLIEDVITRQNSFMNERDFTLNAYEDILENAIGKKYQEIALALKDNSFNFDKYSIIMAHKSAFENDVGVIIDRLKAYCKKENKALVLFSGGTQNYYDNTYNDYLELETKYFYSDNLKLFLDAHKEDNANILMLSYGEKWIVNAVLNILEKVNLFLNTNDDEDILYDEFKNFTEVDKLKNIDYDFYDMVIDDGWIDDKKEIVKQRDDILTYIKNLANA
ncbi:MAG: Unknown protein [uncultured Sulfurovum sp.]|uniref:Uncharacterized protein n=1 Tax=uncultured Sulfurovum sp. TaxID=269237 RepID=A0A6S6SGV1_9BACT|nr:MAG: Unknown protein [uncultured Sulfurovum sp.]